MVSDLDVLAAVAGGVELEGLLAVVRLSEQSRDCLLRPAIRAGAWESCRLAVLYTDSSHPQDLRVGRCQAEWVVARGAVARSQVGDNQASPQRVGPRCQMRVV